MLTEKQRAQAAARQRRFRKREREARTQEQRDKGLPPMPRIPTMPGTARWQATIYAAEALISEAAQEMDNYWADRSDAWQETYAAEEHLRRTKALEKMAEKLANLIVEW